MTRFLCGVAAIAIAGVFVMQTAREARAEEKAKDGIKGQVVFAGAIPKKAAIAPTNDKAYCEKCEKGGLFSEDWLIDPKTKGLQNVLVFLTNPKSPLTPIPHPDMKAIQGKTVVLDQPCCTFIPHMVVLVEGQTLEAKNSSEVAHNTNITSPGGNPSINPALPPGKSIKVDGWKAIGKPSSVACNIHPWMKAWVFTVPSPYFAVTDKDGNFEIKNVPPGEYNIVYWHESLGWLGKAKTKAGDPVVVKAGGVDLGKIKAEKGADD